VIKIGQKDTQYRVNDQIDRYGSCRLIDDEGNQLGIFGVAAAIEKAEDAGLDLVEIAPNADPPVCRIMNYGKFKYERQKKEKENRKNSKAQQVKEMKFRCAIGAGDYETKKRRIVSFLESGNKVRITIMFKGREMSHPELGIEILDKLSTELEGLANIVQSPKLEGRNMTMIVEPQRS
jgi:translation initiation factor IF-3